jgi:hypothetical protein
LDLVFVTVVTFLADDFGVSRARGIKTGSDEVDGVSAVGCALADGDGLKAVLVDEA